MTIRVDEHGAIRLPEEWLAKPGVRAGSQLTAEENDGGVLHKSVTPACEKSLLEMFDEAIAGVPAEVIETWPADGAAEHDHYLYGTPKKSAN